MILIDNLNLTSKFQKRSITKPPLTLSQPPKVHQQQHLSQKGIPYLLLVSIPNKEI